MTARCLKALWASMCCGIFVLASNETGEPTSDIVTIPLDKQYVPVVRNGKTIAHKTAYFGTVFVGLPLQQNFTVVFDTGSGHFLLPSKRCESETCKAHRRYDRTMSPSAIDIDHYGHTVPTDTPHRDQVAISFGTGEVVGEFVYETMCMKDHTGESVELMGTEDLPADCTRMRVILANNMTEDPFRVFEFDGVLGLGLDSLALHPEFSFFEQITRRQALPSPLFGVFVARDDKVTSEISFGGHNPERTSTELEWVSVFKPELGYWQIRVGRVRVGNETLPLCDDGSCVGILDTGTSLLGVPRLTAQTLHVMLAREVEDPPETLDCRDHPGPNLTFELDDGLEISLGHEDYSRPAAMKVQNNKTNTSQVICRSSLLPVDVGPPLGSKVFIFGEPALRKYYTTYDWGAKAVGFSLARQPEAADYRNHKIFGAPLEQIKPAVVEV